MCSVYIFLPSLKNVFDILFGSYGTFPVSALRDLVEVVTLTFWPQNTGLWVTNTLATFPSILDFLELDAGTWLTDGRTDIVQCQTRDSRGRAAYSLVKYKCTGYATEQLHVLWVCIRIRASSKTLRECFLDYNVTTPLPYNEVHKNWRRQLLLIIISYLF